MAKQIQRLAPFRGLNPTYVGEEAGLAEGTFMRGGYNVEVIDAEWWVRHGCGQASESIGGVWWRWIVSSPVEDRLFLVSDRYVVEVESRVADVGVVDNTTFFRQFSIPYLEKYTLDATFTVGTARVGINAVVGPGVPAKGDIFVVNGIAPVPDRVYRVLDIPPGLLIIDRPYESGGALVVTGIRVCADLTATFDGAPGILDADLNGGCCLYEQTATHAVNTLGYNNDAASMGTYIVVVSAAGYFAVPIDSPPKPPILHGFVRETQLPAPTAMTVYNVKPSVYKDRLFLSAADPTMPGMTSLRTFWYSRPFDLLQWHTGLQGLGGTPNYFTLVDPTDPISGFLMLGDTLVVHRRSSQDIVQTYGAGFKVVHNDASIGFWPRSMMEAVPVGQIGWTRYGPALFNEQGTTIMFPELEKMFVAFNQAQRMNPRLRGVLHDVNRRRVHFLLGWEEAGYATTPTEYGTRRLIRHQDASGANPQGGAGPYWRCPVLVVDYARNEAWMEDHAGLCGGGDHLGQMYLFRYDGTVLSHPTGWSGRDFDVNRTNAATPVDATVETQWMRHGVDQRKELQKIYVTMRALDVSEDTDEILGGSFDPLRISDLWDSTSDTLHLCTVEVMIDNRDDVRATADISVSVADMLSRSLEGNRMLPTMLFSITPRVAGRSFKYRFKNTLSSAAAAAGHKVGSFRLVDLVIEFEVESDTRAAGLTGGSP